MDLSASIDIAVPQQHTFDYVMDVTHDTEWRTGVVEAGFTSDGPVGVGSTGFDKAVANGRELVASWTLIEWKPGSHARWSLDEGPIAGTGGYICEDHPAGTRFTLEAFVKPAGLYRLMGPVFGMIGRRQNKRDVTKLKDILEAAT